MSKISKMGDKLDRDALQLQFMINKALDDKTAREAEELTGVSRTIICKIRIGDPSVKIRTLIDMASKL